MLNEVARLVKANRDINQSRAEHDDGSTTTQATQEGEAQRAATRLGSALGSSSPAGATELRLTSIQSVIERHL